MEDNFAFPYPWWYMAKCSININYAKYQTPKAFTIFPEKASHEIYKMMSYKDIMLIIKYSKWKITDHIKTKLAK